MQTSKTFAVVLSGCGHQDGAEIHEATLTLWAIHRNGCEYRCFAPDIDQHHVLDHRTGQEMPERRNVLVEAARIARGTIHDLAELDCAAVDGIVFPGGFGAAKNLCTYAFDGPDCRVQPEVARVIREAHRLGKPIGALCIAPVLVAKVLGDVLVTIGQDQGTAAHLAAMGARHQATFEGEVAVDRDNRIVTTACYMLDARVDQIGESADNVIRAMLELMD